jgi:hypothetical protein
MTEIPDIFRMMVHGFDHEKIKFGMPVKDIKVVFGEPDVVAGKEDYGFWHYGFWRFGYFGGIVDTIVIEFYGEQQVRIDTNLKNVVGEKEFIETGMKLFDFIRLFNFNRIEWSGQMRKYDLDYVTISVKYGSEVIFELDNGEVFQICFRPAN